MKKNNQGFTMIEIIGVVIIMGVLLLLIIPGVSKLMAKFRNDYYEKTELTVNESGKDFFADNKTYLPDGILESSYVSTKSLIDYKYAESLLDYRGNTCKLEDEESYTIVVYRGDGKYVYQTCIDCSDEGYKTKQDGTYCDPAWLSNDNIGYDYGGTDDLYFYYGTSRDKIREKLIKSLNVVKYKTEEKKDEDVLDRIAIGEDGILPTNIDIINNKPELDPETNKKEYEMIYGSETGSDEENLNAIIYKHKAPKVTMTAGGSKYSGYWTNQTVKVTLEKNDDFFGKAGVKVQNYQMKIDNGEWEKVNCKIKNNNYECVFSIDGSEINRTYKFRLINNEGNVSDESEEYKVKIDKIPPTVYLSVNSSVKIHYNKYLEDCSIKRLVNQYGSASCTSSDNVGSSVYSTISSNCSGSLSSLNCTSAGTVSCWAVDVAGNSSGKKTGTIGYSETSSVIHPPAPKPNPENPTEKPNVSTGGYDCGWDW